MRKHPSGSNASIFNKKLLSALIALSATPAVAQVEEEVVVVGVFERNLQNAIDLKRNSSTIMDGISAEDIGSLPALDLGEALQAVPGVQLNREGERRESGISLRGLPGLFVQSTVNGQTISAPTRSDPRNIFGGSNPFGSYDAAIFNGVNVVKTPEASSQEGGIAGVIDMRLPTALSRNNSGFVQLGARLEELSGETDPEMVAGGTLHIIDDVLAVTGTVAFSEQNFREDYIRTNRYDVLDDGGRYTPGAGQPATFQEWRDFYSIPDGDTVAIGGELRQGTEINSGTRLSYAGNVEFQATDELKLSASVMATDHDMGDNRLEQLELRVRSGSGTRYSEQDITPLSAPINTGVTVAGGNINGAEDGSNVWVVNDIAIGDANYYWDVRQYELQRSSNAFFLGAEWESDSWKVDATLAFSDAENTLNEALFSPRTESRRGPNGVQVERWNNGGSDISSYVLEIDRATADAAIDLDNWDWGYRGDVTDSGIIPGESDAAREDFLLTTGIYQTVEKEATSFELNFEKTFDEGGISSVEFGYRFSNEEESNFHRRNSGAGIDAEAIFTNDIRTAPVANNDFFGGEAPGYGNIDDGWYSFDWDTIFPQVIASIDEAGVLPVRDNRGELYQRSPNGLVVRANRLNDGPNFDAELETNALYTQANFDTTAGSFPVRGNLGLRYVSSEVETSAPVYSRIPSAADPVTNPNGVDIQTVIGSFKDDNSYAYILPSFNATVNLHEDVLFRMAYSESLSRPSLRATNPNLVYSFDSAGDAATIRKPGVDLDPFTSTNYDLSLEWYNTESSSIALAYFKKEIDNFYVLNSDAGTCDTADGTFGNLSLDAGGNCITDGNDIFGGDPDQLIPGAVISEERWVNDDRQIRVEGIEIALNQKLSFLPYPWNGFGGTVNYTSLGQSSDDRGDGSGQINIQGVSDQAYNLIVFYDHSDFGVRLAYNERSEYSVQSSNTLVGLSERTVKPVGRLDLSAYYKITNDFKVSLKGYNLTDEIYEEYQDNELLPRRANYIGTQWVISASYKF